MDFGSPNLNLGLIPSAGNLVSYDNIYSLLTYVATQLEKIKLLKWTYNFKCNSFSGKMPISASYNKIFPNSAIDYS